MMLLLSILFALALAAILDMLLQASYEYNMAHSAKGIPTPACCLASEFDILCCAQACINHTLQVYADPAILETAHNAGPPLEEQAFNEAHMAVSLP